MMLTPVVYSVENCDLLLNADGVRWLCSRLMDYDPSRQLLFSSVEILWNVFEKCTNRQQLKAQLNDAHCIRCGAFTLVFCTSVKCLLF